MFGVDLNKLVEVKVSGGGSPAVDYSKLQEVCLKLFNSTKHALNKMRRHMDKKIIERYEGTIIPVPVGEKSGTLMYI
jgi:hypothetical protein